jgi:hypothetical protein
MAASDPKSAYLAKARAAAEKLYRARGTPISVDDVRVFCPPPANLDPRIMGAIFQRTVWRRAGYVASVRDTCHHRPIAAFELRPDAAEASTLDRLADNTGVPISDVVKVVDGIIEPLAVRASVAAEVHIIRSALEALLAEHRKR